MKTLIFILMLLTIPFSMIYAQEPGASGLGDSLYPEFGNGGYDVQHYALNIVADPARGKIQSTVMIEAIATQDLASFNLDFVGLEVEAVTVNEQVVTYERNGQELTIFAELASEAPFTVTIRYSGVPEYMDSVVPPAISGWIVNYDRGSYVISQPDGAANFYPVNDHPSDKATYEFWITVPERYTAVANGVLQEITVNADGTHTFHWLHDYPMASYLTTINIGSFELQEEIAPTGLPIRNYFPPNLDPALRETFALQGEMIAYFTELFGDYPFDVYGAIVVNETTGSALETQTISIFGLDSVEEKTVVHEVAHQWFGNSVSIADWRDLWLNEGIAYYAQGLWVEHREGETAFNDWVAQKYAYVARAVEQNYGMVPPGNPPADDLFNDGVYVWGAMTFHALRLTVGDEVFFDILRTYHERYKYSNATTADFIAVAEEVSGEELTAFFEAWLYSGTLPELPAAAE